MIDVLSVLIWVLPVCKGYQQVTKAASKERVKSPRQTAQTMIRLIRVFIVCYSDKIKFCMVGHAFRKSLTLLMDRHGPMSIQLAHPGAFYEAHESI